MRKLLVGLAIVSLATSAMGASLQVIPKIADAREGGAIQVGVYPRGITPDGRFVGGVAGLALGSGGQDTGFVFDTWTGVAGQVIGGGYNESVDGIGYWTDGTTTKVVVVGANSGWQSMNAWDISTNWDGVTHWEKNRRTSTHAYIGSGTNRVAGTSDGTLLHAVFQTHNTQLYIDTYTGVDNGSGLMLVTTPDKKGTTENATMHGISNAGLAVGTRGGRLYTLQYTGSGGGSAAFVNAAPNGSDEGTFYDIADDGSIMGGSGRSFLPGNWAFVYDGTRSIQLPTLTLGDTLYATMGVVYGISPNGEYAVGMDYSMGREMAVLWDLRDLDNIVAIDLTAYATEHGILGPFDGNLRRATAIGINADGNPVITGIGYAQTLEANGWTGFVLTIPEPATLTFLGLGALALLRRRR